MLPHPWLRGKRPGCFARRRLSNVSLANYCVRGANERAAALCLTSFYFHWNVTNSDSFMSCDDLAYAMRWPRQDKVEGKRPCRDDARFCLLGHELATDDFSSMGDRSVADAGIRSPAE